MNVYYNADIDDDTRREQLYAGQLYVYSPRPTTLALCELAREMSEAAFAPYHPTEAQYHLPVERYADATWCTSASGGS